MDRHITINGTVETLGRDATGRDVVALELRYGSPSMEVVYRGLLISFNISIPRVPM